MRKILIDKGNTATLLPLLDGLIADLNPASQPHHAVAKTVYLLLRTWLTADLTIVQYEHIRRDAEQYWQAYLQRHADETAVQPMQSWIVQQYILRQYFASGLFLDDIRSPTDLSNYMNEVTILPYLLGKWTVVRSFEEFAHCIRNDSPYERISLDHDLGEDRDGHELPSGYDALKWLVNYHSDNKSKLLPMVLCHSQNPVGKENIQFYWQNFIKSINTYNLE